MALLRVSHGQIAYLLEINREKIIKNVNFEFLLTCIIILKLEFSLLFYIHVQNTSYNNFFHHIKNSYF